jgi:hypothetical protein
MITYAEDLSRDSLIHKDILTDSSFVLRYIIFSPEETDIGTINIDLAYKKDKQLNNQEIIQLTDFWGGIGDFFTAIGQFFSFQSTFGYYKEKGQNGHGPYTLFDRTSPKSITQQLTSYPPYFQVLPIRQIAHW